MATINVNRNLTDQFYRYKMPKLIAKVEGKGNGIKTVIVNMVEIGKSLNRPPMYPTKYFGCVLGAQVNCDPKNDRYIVNGAHESAKLQDLLDGFIQKYVLCTSCGNPETVLGVTKKGVITTSCKACGFNGTITSQDKLNTYIVKYPPAQKVAAAGPSLQPKSEKKRDKKKKDGKGNENGSPKNGSENENGDDKGEDGDDDDVDWGEDTDEQAVQKRMEELSVGAKGLMHTNELEKSSEERLQIFFDFVQKKKSQFPDGFDQIVQKEIAGEADRLEIKDKAVLALCEALFDENMLAQIKQHRQLLLRFTHENVKSQKYLLRGIELLIKMFQKDLLPKVAHILKAFYDSDILSEEAILDWGHSKSGKKTVGKELAEEMRSKAAPFLKWLEEADEEESSSDDESGEEDPWSESKPSNLTINLNGNGTVQNNKGVIADSDDKDFNIDDI